MTAPTVFNAKFDLLDGSSFHGLQFALVGYIHVDCHVVEVIYELSQGWVRPWD